MPRFSICIATYNDARSLSDCLESVLAQDFDDFEVVVANDGSTDDTDLLLTSYSLRDRRIIPISLPQNLGTHCARAAAVQKASSEYVLFLDSDDALIPQTLSMLDERLRQTGADYLHFGMELVASAEIRPEDLVGMRLQANACLQVESGQDLLVLAYAIQGGYQLDWRVTQRAISSSIVKRAFEVLPCSRIEFAEDGLEHLAIALFVQHPVIANDIVGYRYNYGAGATGGKDFSLSAWERMAASFGSASRACYSLVDQFDFEFDPTLLDVAQAAADGFSSRLGELLFAEWRDRKDPQIAREVFECAARHYGAVPTAAQIMRIVRDAAYEAWDAGATLDGNEPFLAWFSQAERLLSESGCMEGVDSVSRDPAYALCKHYRDAAAGHIADLRQRTLPSDEEVGEHGFIRRFLSRVVKKIR